MELEKARAIAEEIKERLTPYCRKIEVAGSIRRRKPVVRDIDIVLIPNDLWNLHAELMKLGQVRMSGSKILRVMVGYTQVDIYVADEATWATLLLIRTGSTEHNIRLCARAKTLGMKLHADGSGLFKITTCPVGTPREDKIAGDSEQSIYQALGLAYKEPWERN